MNNKKWAIPRKDCLAAVIFFVFGVLMLALIIPFGIPVGVIPPGQISPRFLPNVISAAITVIAALMLLIPSFKLFRGGAVISEDSEKVDTEEVSKNVSDEIQDGRSTSSFLKWAPILSIVIIIGYFFLLVWAGFIVSSAVAMMATMLTFGERRWWIILMASTAVPLVVWSFATKLLHLPMP